MNFPGLCHVGGFHWITSASDLGQAGIVGIHGRRCEWACALFYAPMRLPAAKSKRTIMGGDCLVEYNESDSSALETDAAAHIHADQARPSDSGPKPVEAPTEATQNQEGTAPLVEGEETVPKTSMEGVNPDLLNKITRFKALRDQGIFFNDNLIKNKSYRNPHIYAQLVQFLNIQETGTNFQSQVWDPLGFPKEAYSDSLRQHQQRLTEEKQNAQSNGKRTAIEFEKSSSSSHKRSHHYQRPDNLEFDRDKRRRERRKDRSRSPRRR
ncbi:hypothetical protein O181_089233 [Austropuccinia psidii MF-1]|uniref:HCNGP-domain-containing protein n=1 Tax=Austropuccinia psidii MF-1 TaxID=1389203 RepID=A0A9Q3ISW2_9BASI|nr:hypothetical protein [Austropuccinia psidii MF-1]